jgi:3-oxoacyl-[acyl-carrier protein] reductase
MSALKDRVALVTGSSRGIGAAIAITFANTGARVGRGTAVDAG